VEGWSAEISDETRYSHQRFLLRRYNALQCFARRTQAQNVVAQLRKFSRRFLPTKHRGSGPLSAIGAARGSIAGSSAVADGGHIQHADNSLFSKASSIALTDRAAIKAKIEVRDHTHGQNMTIE
jgi:hypothetical protein